MSTTPTPSAEVLRRLVELATRAPSIHNTQPWHWRATEDGLELHADRSRQLRVADPQGRSLAISCGAVLHHLLVVARASGWEAEVRRLPDGSSSSLLARVLLRRGTRSETAEADLRAIDERCTDRRRFTSWPVPDERLQHLANLATEQGVRALPLVTVSERFRAELLVNRAADRQAADPRFAVEQQAWVDHSSVDGVPSTVLPSTVLPSQAVAAGGSRTTRFASGAAEEAEPLLEGADGLVILCSGADDVGQWLIAGEALSALWLTATTQGLSVVPLSQVVEVAETRDALQHDVLGGLARPLLLVRIGWQAISRSQLPRTCRRPVEDVLDVR